jgi:hypothetical protein
MTFNDAEVFCTARGAHLTTYSNLDEQIDAEGYYIRLGGWSCCAPSLDDGNRWAAVCHGVCQSPHMCAG